MKCPDGRHVATHVSAKYRYVLQSVVTVAMGRAMPLAHPKKNLQSVTLHRNLPVMRTIYAAIFALGHAMAVSYAISTAGEPYQAALAQAAKLDNATNGTNATLNSTANLFEATTPKAVEPVPEPPSQPAKATDGGFGDEEWPVEDDDLDVPPLNDSTANSSLKSLNTTIEKKERPLPHEWLPSALACALLFVSVISNSLFYLLCHWSVGWKARWLFAPASEPEVGRYLYFVPLAHKGKPAIVKVSRAAGEGGRLTCEYQRQRYELRLLTEVDARPKPTNKAAAEAAALIRPENAAWAVELISCPTDLPHAEYTKSKGLIAPTMVAAAKERYGTNVLSVQTPKFIDLYFEQLLSPLVIFQLFTSFLWLLDAVSYGFLGFQVCVVVHAFLGPSLSRSLTHTHTHFSHTHSSHSHTPHSPLLHTKTGLHDPHARVDLRLPEAAHPQDAQPDVGQAVPPSGVQGGHLADDADRRIAARGSNLTLAANWPCGGRRGRSSSSCGCQCEPAVYCG